MSGIRAGERLGARPGIGREKPVNNCPVERPPRPTADLCSYVRDNSAVDVPPRLDRAFIRAFSAAPGVER